MYNVLYIYIYIMYVMYFLYIIDRRSWIPRTRGWSSTAGRPRGTATGTRRRPQESTLVPLLLLLVLVVVVVVVVI